MAGKRNTTEAHDKAVTKAYEKFIAAKMKAKQNRDLERIRVERDYSHLVATASQEYLEAIRDAQKLLDEEI